MLALPTMVLSVALRIADGAQTGDSDSPRHRRRW